MSRLLGPLSETINSVSDRASALAADQIAGAGTIAPAATPVTDFRKSRRFMGCSKRLWGNGFGTESQGSCQSLRKAWYPLTLLILLEISPRARRRAGCDILTNCIQRGIFAH